jgi:ATP-dependent DNA helicase RecG
MKFTCESETIEFKRSTSELSQAIVSISAILNKHNHGIIYFGVANDGTVIGQEIGVDTLRTISQKISSHVKPLPQFSVEHYISDSLSFIEVKFSGTAKPYSAFGKYYYRHADEDNEMSTSQLASLFRLEDNYYSEWNNALTDLSISDVDENLVKRKYNEGLRINRFREEYTNITDVLTSLNLYKNGYLTNSCKYLFSKSKPILVKLAVFATNEKLTFLNMDHFYGNIFECIDKTIEYISEHINWRVKIQAITRLEIPEVPIEAIREIVVNSFAHADYQHMISSHEINIYPDRITIFNPGQLPYEIDLDDFENGKSKSILLNPSIANTLFRVGAIEAFGTGFKRTFALCKDNNIKYSYYINFQGFEFQFDRGESYDMDDDRFIYKLSETPSKVFQLLKTDNFTIQELSLKTGFSTRTIEKTLSSLKNNGYIERTGSNKKGFWKILKK